MGDIVVAACIGESYLAFRKAQRIEYTGLDEAFNNYQFEGEIFAIAVSPFGRIYIGGDFTLTNNNTVRSNIAAFSSSGVLQSWNPVVNGIVKAIAVSSLGDTIYIGGNFGALLAISDTGKTISNWNEPVIVGDINTIVILLQTIYIGGVFEISDNDGNIFKNVAAFNENGELQQQFNPLLNATQNTSVNAIAISPDHVYIGGVFTISNNITSNNKNVAKFNVTGQIQQFNPLEFAISNTSVNAIAVSADQVYIGGEFVSEATFTIVNVAEFDASLGGLRRRVFPAPTGPINAIAISNNKVYIGGNFKIGEYINAASFDLTYVQTNEIQQIEWHPIPEWNPSPRNISDNLSVVNAITISNENIYIGGRFNTIDDKPKLNVAKVNELTGKLIRYIDDIDITQFNNYQFEGVINDISIAQNGNIFVVGNFILTELETDNIIRRNAAAFNPNGELLSWNPSPNGEVFAVDASSAIIYIGGQFTYELNDNIIRTNAAAFNANGVLQNWNPSPGNNNDPTINSYINVIKVIDDIIYMGGSFARVRNEAGEDVIRFNAAAFDATGVLQDWNPAPNGEVNVIAGANGIIYIGGSFDAVSGSTVTRNNIAAFNSAGVLQTNWNPSPNGNVNTIAILNNIIYFGGNFTTVGDTERNNAAAFNLDGVLQINWNPSPNGVVNSIVVSSSLIYIGGDFETVLGAEQLPNAAAFNAVGELQDWNPELNGPVTSIAISSLNIYIGGFFTNVNGYINKDSTVEVNRITGDIIDFVNTTDVNTTDTIYKYKFTGAINIIVVLEEIIYVGGSFTLREIDGVSDVRTNIAAFNLDEELLNWNPRLLNGIVNTSVVVNTIASLDGIIYIGGLFDKVGTVTRNNIAAFNLAGVLQPWNPSPNGVINAIAIFNKIIYFGGKFTRVGATQQTRNRVAAFNLAGVLQPWNPSPNNDVNAIVTHQSLLYIGGSFTSVFGGVSQNRVAAFNLNGVLQTNWNPSPNGEVNTIAILNNIIYFGGNFTTVGATQRNNIAAFNLDGLLQPWNPSPNGEVNAIVAHKSLLYIGGGFTTVGTNAVGATTPITPRINTAAFDILGNLQNWNLSLNSGVNTIAFSRSKMYIGTDTVGNDTTTFTSGSLVKIASPLLERIGGAIANSIFNDYKFGEGSNVKAIAIQNEIVYIGGSFELLSTASNNTIRKNVAAFDFNGELLDWDPLPNDNENTSVNAIAISSQNIIYIGGVFAISDNRNVAAFNENGGLQQINPLVDANPNTSVNAIAISSQSNIIYIGGVFTVGENTNVAKFNNSGVIQTWNPLESANPNTSVNAIAISPDGNSIYIGGVFTVGANKNVAKFNNSGGIQNGNPLLNAISNTSVNAIAISPDHVYIGGQFKIPIRNSSTDVLSCIIKINNNTGVLQDSWSPNVILQPDTSNLTSVNTISILNNNDIYIGGNFNIVLSTSLNNAALLTTTETTLQALLQPWNPSPNGVVNAIAASSSGIYVGGVFSKINNVDKTAIAKVDSINGKTIGLPATDVALLNYPLDATSTSVFTLVASPDEDVIYVGGIFSIKDPVSGSPPRRNVAAFSTIDGSMLPWNPSPVMVGNEPSGAVVYAIAIFNKNIYIGGTFQEVHRFNGLGGTTRIRRNNIAGFTPEGALLPWDPSPIGSNPPATAYRVAAIVGHKSFIYFGGIFTSVKFNNTIRVNRTNAAAFDENGVLQNWTPSTVLTNVLCMAALNDTIYIGGVGSNAFNTAIGVFEAGNSSSGIVKWEPAIYNNQVANSFAADPPQVTSISTHDNVSNSNRIIVIGGRFIGVNPLVFQGFGGVLLITPNRSCVAALNADGGLFSWNPSPSHTNGSSIIRSIHIIETGTTNSLEIRIGGSINQLRSATTSTTFNVVGAQNTATIGFLSSTTNNFASGLVLNNNNPRANENVFAIAQVQNRFLQKKFYWGGDFTTLDTKLRFKVGTTESDGTAILRPGETS